VASFGRGAIIAAAIAVVMSPACTYFEPETGDLLPPCVDADSAPGVAVNFHRDIRPIMHGEIGPGRPCANCHYHSEGSHEGIDTAHFDLETLGSLRKGGNRTGAGVIVPGSPCKSGIVQKVRGTFDGPRMPKGGPYWTDAQIQLLADWIAEGAKGDDGE
jgi:hypothetical protein